MRSGRGHMGVGRSGHAVGTWEHAVGKREHAVETWGHARRNRDLGRGNRGFACGNRDLACGNRGFAWWASAAGVGYVGRVARWRVRRTPARCRPWRASGRPHWRTAPGTRPLPRPATWPPRRETPVAPASDVEVDLLVAVGQ